MRIEVSGLCKSYGGKEVLKGVSFSADEGECIGILGANGSGKSTLLSILAGVIRCSAGSFSVSGKAAYIPQGTPLVEELSAYDNLRLWYKKHEIKESLNGGVLETLGIRDFLKKKAGSLSGGMRKRLSIGCALSAESSVLLLDEPSAALDLSYKKKMLSYYRDFAKGGGTAVLVTHDIQEMQICTRFLLMRGGILSPYSPDLKSERGLSALAELF